MSFEEWFQKRFGHSFGGVSDEDIFLSECWNAAIASEREACAKVCDSISYKFFPTAREAYSDCAAAIRARTKEK